MSGALPDLAVRPAHQWSPPSVTTNGDLAAEIGSLLGLVPDPDQRAILDVIFAERADSTPSCFEVGIVAPRQNLKTATLEVAALTWLFIFRCELVVWTAHLFKTTRKSFEHMAAMIDAVPDFRRRCRPHRTANGNEAIELRSGESIEFYARSKGGGRGLTGNRTVLDEALFLEPAHMGALLPTMATIRDAQVLYASSAGLGSSNVLRGVRDRGRTGGVPRLGWFEWAAARRDCSRPYCRHEVGAVGCALDDRELWSAANPALGRRITVEFLADMRRALPPGEFAREFLGWWEDPAAVSRVVPAEAWQACLVRPADAAGVAGPVAFAVDMTPERSRSAVGVAQSVGDRLLVECVDERVGTWWLPDRVVELADRHPGARWLVESRSPAASLIDALAGRVEVVPVSAQDMARACGSFFDAATTHRLAHLGQPELSAALEGATTRPVGDAWAWARRHDGVNIAPLVAVTLAAHGLSTAPEPIDSTVLIFR